MNISEISRAVSPPVQTEAKQNGGIVSKDDFLKLLVTQMQFQDPMNPQDPTQYTSQLAQFSSLEQLIGVNSSLSNLASVQSANNQITAAGFIGRKVQMSGDMLTVGNGAASPARFDLASASAATSLEIYNAAGQLIQVVDLGALPSGAHDYQWNAATATGPVADGQYRYAIAATDAAGADISAQTRFSGVVTGVSFDQCRPKLQIGGQTWPLENVMAIEANG